MIQNIAIITQLLEKQDTYASGIAALEVYLMSHPEDVEALLLKTNVSFDTYYTNLNQHREVKDDLSNLYQQYNHILSLAPDNAPAKSGWIWANIQLGLEMTDPDLMEAYLKDLVLDETFKYRGLQYELEWLQFKGDKERALLVLDQLIEYVKVKYGENRNIVDKYNSDWYLEKMKILVEMPIDMSVTILSIIQDHMPSFVYTNGYGYWWIAHYLVEQKQYDVLANLMDQAEHYFLTNTTQIDEYGYQLYELILQLVKNNVDIPKLLYHYLVLINNCHEALDITVEMYRKELFRLYDTYPEAVEIQMAMSSYFYHYQKDYKGALPYYETALESGVAYPVHLAKYIESYYKVYEEAPIIPDRYFMDNRPVQYYMASSFIREVVTNLDKSANDYDAMMNLCLKFHEKADHLFESYFYGGNVSSTIENTKENWAKLCNNYAIIYMHLLRYDDAIYIAEKGLGIHPFWELNQKLALAHGHAANLEGEENAIKALLNTELKTIEYEEYLYHKTSLVECLLKQNKTIEAVETYRDLRVEFVANLYKFGYSKIDIYLLEHFLHVETLALDYNTNSAAKAAGYEELIRFYPKHIMLYTHLVMYYIEMLEWEKAEKTILVAISIYENENWEKDLNWAYLYTQYAFVMYKNGSYKMARAVTQEVMNLFPQYEYAKKVADTIPFWNKSIRKMLGIRALSSRN